MAKNFNLELDLDIFLAFNKLTDSGKTTTWEIAKKIYPEITNNRLLSVKCKKIERRLKKLQDFGFVYYNNKEFIFNKDTVKFKKINFPSGRKDAILLEFNNRWNVFEI